MARRRRPPRAGALGELQPLKILGQIASLQGIYYAIALVLMVFTGLVSGMGFHLSMVLGWEIVRGDNTTGWVMAFVWLLDGGLCIPLAIVALIGRSKLVPDFALTLHFIHLVVTSVYVGHVPTNVMWWAVMFASAGMSVALGIWGCRYRELQPVFFGSRRILGSSGTGVQVSTEEGEQAGDEEMGMLGRGRDEFEMEQIGPGR